MEVTEVFFYPPVRFLTWGCDVKVSQSVCSRAQVCGTTFVILEEKRRRCDQSASFNNEMGFVGTLQNVVECARSCTLVLAWHPPHIDVSWAVSSNFSAFAVLQTFVIQIMVRMILYMVTKQLYISRSEEPFVFVF